MFHSLEAKSIYTPIETNSVLDAKRYVPDITHASVRIYARFHGCPTESHSKVAQRILRHFKKTGTWFYFVHHDMYSLGGIW